MKKLIIIILLIFSFQVFSQAPVLDSANFSFKVEDTVFSWNGMINNYFNPGVQGSNVYWDFSNINFTIPINNSSQLQYRVYKYVNSFNSNIQTVYQPANGVMITCYDRYLSLLNSVSFFESVCIGTGSAGSSGYMPNKKIIVYPFTYQSYYFDSTISSESSYPYGNNVHTHVYYNMLGDGWGTLKLLNKTHYNVLRINSNTVVFDSSQTTIKRIDSTYFWVKPYNFNSLLSMSSIWTNNNGIWTNEKFAYITPYGLEYIPAFLNVSSYDNELLRVFPNPASDYIYIENIKEKARIEIYNMSGILQYTADANGDSNINIRNLSDGLYLVKIQTDSSVAIKKLLKQ